MRELYNEKLKLAYIDDYQGEDSTKKTIYYEFLNSAKVERDYNKDLYAFNDVELADLLKTLAFDNESSLQKSLSHYKDYVNWCIVNGQRKEYEKGTNYVEVFQKVEDLSKYVSNKKINNKYLTKEEFQDLIDLIENETDKALIYALYELINGKELYELRSIKIENVNKENKTIELTDKDGKTRISQISDRFIKLLEDANKQKEYTTNNGNPSPNAPRKQLKLLETGYVFRGLDKGSLNRTGMMGYLLMSQTIVRIKNFTGYNFLSASSLRDTRYIHEITDIILEKQLYEPNDEVYDEFVRRMYEKFQIKISIAQLYNIKSKYKNATRIKNFY